MATELTRVKEVLENIEPAKLNEYFKVRKLELEISKTNVKKVLENIKDMEIFLELDKIYFFNQAPEEFEKILSFYQEATNSPYNNSVLALRKEENLTELEKALFLAINDGKFFEYCFNAINVFARNTVNYEIFTGVKQNIKILDENIPLLENAIGEFSNKTFKSGTDCVIEHFNLCDKDFFVIYTNKGAKLYTEIKGKKINRIKQKPVLEMTFIYNPKEGKLEVGILNYRAKLLDFTGLFGKHILQDDINTSNLKKVYDLGKIKRSINRIGDFKFVNTKEIQVHIADLYYNTSDNFFGSIGGNKRNQGTFLNKVQKDKFLANAELVKIRMIAKYKEETENKTRAFTIEGNKCNLSHDKTDVKIRNILKNSGLEAMTHLEIIQAFKEYLIKGKVVNLYNISKIQGNPQPFSYLIAKGFLTQVNDISYNLYCEECLKVCNMEEMGEILTCGCGSNLFKEHLTDIEDYILNFEEIKEMLISHLKITKDDNIEDDTYFAFHNYGNTGKVNLHLAKEEIEIEKLKQDIAKEKIIISVYGMAEEKLENCLVIPLYNLLESNNIKFCKTKFAEAVRVFVTEVKKSKTENTKQLLNEKIEYAKSINNEKLTCEQLFDIYSKRYGGSLRTFKSHIWINIKTSNQSLVGRPSNNK